MKLQHTDSDKEIENWVINQEDFLKMTGAFRWLRKSQLDDRWCVWEDSVIHLSS